MRIGEHKYETMRAAMLGIIQGVPGGAATIRAEYAGLSKTRMLFDTWHVAKRSLPGFDEYSNGDNDEHIETVLRKIGKELSLCSY